ncbi:MAG: hypothetical protein WBE72_21280 [Terracidiphilus sp.]
MSSNKRRLFRCDAPGLTRSPSPNCPICGTPNADFAFDRPFETHGPGASQLLRGWCPACSNVFIATSAANEVRQRRKGHLLSAYLRRLPPNDEFNPIVLEDLEKLTSSIPELNVVDQFDLALQKICEMCPVVGLPSRFDYQSDWPLLTAQSADTALFIVRELANAGYLYDPKDSAPIPPKPTWKAYERLQQIQSSGRSSEVEFVAMSFSSEQIPVWLQAIKPGIEDAGYRPFRVDQNEHNRRIDDEIIAGVRRCRFLVADFTGQKNGVYFEAGMALGLGRNVVWMCNHSDKDHLHFDTRQFNHILYDDLIQARIALTNRIVALEGPGNYVPPSSLLS